MSKLPASVPADFVAQAAQQGILFDEGDLEALDRYLDLLYEANTRFNLTAVSDRGVAWTRHIFDSLTLIALLAELQADFADDESSPSPKQGTHGTHTPHVKHGSDHALRVIDIGSGGGLPGIPLAICMPNVRFTLLEATGKKADFLNETAHTLGLRNVTVVNERAEIAAAAPSSNSPGGRFRESFDAVIARAVGPLQVLLELTIPFAMVGGLVLAIKGEKAAEEVEGSRQALHRLHAGVLDMLRTPTGTIVVVEKRRPTPRQYPRAPGEPKRKPLG